MRRGSCRRASPSVRRTSRRSRCSAPIPRRSRASRSEAEKTNQFRTSVTRRVHVLSAFGVPVAAAESLDDPLDVEEALLGVLVPVGCEAVVGQVAQLRTELRDLLVGGRFLLQPDVAAGVVGHRTEGVVDAVDPFVDGGGPPVQPVVESGELLDCVLVELFLELVFEPRQVVGGDPLPEGEEVSSRLDVGIEVRTQLGPAPQHLTHVLDEALAEAAQFASEMLDLLGQLVGERRLDRSALFGAGRQT